MEISHPSVWHMLCAHIHIHTQSKRAMCLHNFPLSHYPKSRSMRRLWRHLLTMGCYLMHAASTHHYLLSLQYICLCMTACVRDRWEHTNFPLGEKHLTPLHFKVVYSPLLYQTDCTKIKEKPYNILGVIHYQRFCLAEDRVRRTQANQQGAFTE